MDYIVSVIIPVYNSMPYIEKCIESALDQDLDNIEYVIVDDYGTDNSIETVKKMISNHPKKDNFFFYDAGKNQGVAEARNLGIRKSRGKYIYFLDSDDIIRKNCISEFVRIAEEHSLEFVFGVTGYDTDALNANKEIKYIICNKKNLEQYHNLMYYIYKISPNKYLCNNCFNCLILSSIIKNNDISFPKFKKGEDLLFMQKLMPYITYFAKTDDITYIYVKHENSLMQYNARNIIPQSEIEEAIKVSLMFKHFCASYIDTDFGDEIISYWMKSSFWSILSILKKRKITKPAFPHKMMKEYMKHPLKIKRILRMKENKLNNLFFAMLGIIPQYVSYKVYDLIIYVKK